MSSKRLTIFVVLSIVLHFVLFFIFDFVHGFLPEHQPREEKKSVRITLLEPSTPTAPKPEPLQPSKPVPPPKLFVDTEALPKNDNGNPDTFLESANATKAASKNPGQGSQFLPNQKGIDVPDIELTNSLPSVANNGTPQPPSPKPPDPTPKPESPKVENPAQKPDPAKPDAVKPDLAKTSEQKEKPDPTTPPDPAKTAQPKPQVKPNDVVPLRPEGDIEVAKAQPEPQVKPSAPTAPKQPTPDNSQSRSPPTTFAALKQQTTIKGGAAQGVSPSVDSKDTDLGRYKAKLFRGIGSRWYIYVQQDNGLLGVGNVKIRFYVRSDGVITNLEIVQGKQNAQLAAISRRSIQEISGQLEPFSDSLKVQLGDGYYEEVTFSIY